MRGFQFADLEKTSPANVFGGFYDWAKMGHDSQGRRLRDALIVAGIAAAISGCSATGSHPPVSERTTPPSALVPGAVARFSTPPQRALDIETPQAEKVTESRDNSGDDDSKSQAIGRRDSEARDKGSAGASDVAESSETFFTGFRREDGPAETLTMNDEPEEETEQPIQMTSSEENASSPPQMPTDEESVNVTVQSQVPIDLAWALQLTAGQNPQVGYAQERIQEAYAQLRLAESLWVPSIRYGVNYNKHAGIIQDVRGTMIETYRSSVYTGMGALAVGAGSPAVPGLLMNFHLRDAIFQPRIVEQALGARQHASRTATNDMLLETALRYMDLLEAIQVLAVAQDTLDHAKQLSELTNSFAETGQGLQADADRALAELAVRQIEIRRAAENVRVASVRLARVLSQQDQSLMLVPQEPALVPIDLVVPSSQLSELVATGLTNRPELAESQHLVGEAVERLRRECFAPLVPSVLLGLSYGGNGGSPTSTITNFADRADFDAGVFWEIRNFGFGEHYARKGARSQLEQIRWRQVQVMDQVASDVAESHAQVQARQSQIKLAEAGIAAAQDSYRRNSERIRDGQGLPIETLQSIQALDQARRLYVRAVADYNRAQFQLQRALGWPIE